MLANSTLIFLLNLVGETRQFLCEASTDYENSDAFGQQPISPLSGVPLVRPVPPRSLLACNGSFPTLIANMEALGFESCQNFWMFTSPLGHLFKVGSTPSQ